MKQKALAYTIYCLFLVTSLSYILAYWLHILGSILVWPAAPVRTIFFGSIFNMRFLLSLHEKMILLPLFLLLLIVIGGYGFYKQKTFKDWPRAIQLLMALLCILLLSGLAVTLLLLLFLTTYHF